MIQHKYLTLVLAAVLIGGACQKAGNTANSNTTAVASNTNAVATNSAPASDAGNISGSPSDVYKVAYTARKNKDIATLKRVMSKELLGFLTDMGAADKKSLDDTLNEVCAEPQAATAEARNEKIDGDHATIEYKDDDNSWQPMAFVREDGAWKMDLGKDDRKEADKLKADKEKK